MARIIAGSAKGRNIAVPEHGTRPTTDRVREAIFNTLAALNAIVDAKILDLYAGSGALGLEALSRGAQSGVFIDNNRSAAEVIRINAGIVAAHSEVICTSVIAYLHSLENTNFDLIFCDPPYQLSSEKVTEILRLCAHLMSETALIVLERSTKTPPVTIPDTLTLYSKKIYGDTCVVYIERNNAA